MTQPAPELDSSSIGASPKGPGKRATILMSVVALLCVMIPLLFWHGTWFGRALSDEQITEYLAEQHDQPRHTQHALVQISERMSRGETSAEQWYPQLLSLAGHELPELRLTVAWVMGQDNENEQFHEKLRELVRDSNPMVRRNAALSLARFGDAAGRPELLAMLQPQTMVTEHAGVVRNRLHEGDVVDRGTLLLRVEAEGAPEPLDVRSEIPGIVRKQLKNDGELAQPGEGVTLLGPNPEHAYQALRGLYLVGMREDAEVIRPFLVPSENNPNHVAEQARLTIEKLSGNSSP